MVVSEKGVGPKGSFADPVERSRRRRQRKKRGVSPSGRGRKGREVAYGGCASSVERLWLGEKGGS